MSLPPRNPNTPQFGKMTIALSLLQGLSVLTLVFAVYTLTLYRGQVENEARALTYITLIISNLALILANRSWSRKSLDD
jgi:P-type Ca2+ transporter type 2C